MDLSQLLVFAAPELPNLDSLFATLIVWLTGLIATAGGFFLLLDMTKHIFKSPRDLRAAGMELLVFVILVALVSQTSTIVEAAQGLIGTNATNTGTTR